MDGRTGWEEVETKIAKSCNWEEVVESQDRTRHEETLLIKKEENSSF